MCNFTLSCAVDLCPAARTAIATETSTSKLTIAVFSAKAVLMTKTLMATAGRSPALIVGFRLGCSVMKSAMGVL
jgi:hypothetical protein